MPVSVSAPGPAGWPRRRAMPASGITEQHGARGSRRDDHRMRRSPGSLRCGDVLPPPGTRSAASRSPMLRSRSTRRIISSCSSGRQRRLLPISAVGPGAELLGAAPSRHTYQQPRTRSPDSASSAPSGASDEPFSIGNSRTFIGGSALPPRTALASSSTGFRPSGHLVSVYGAGDGGHQDDDRHRSENRGGISARGRQHDNASDGHDDADQNE